MNAQQTIDTILFACWENDPETLYNDDVDAYDYDDPKAFFSDLAALNTQAPVGLPDSFREFIARYGYTDMGSWDYVMRIWALQLFPSDGWNPFEAELYPADYSVQVNAQKATTFNWVDNPGDAHGYEFLLTDPALRDSIPELWLYRGWDYSWEDGITLAPLGVSFWEVAAISLSGLGDALFSPSNEKAAALEKLDSTKTDLYRDLLTGLEELASKTSGFNYTCDGMNGPITWTDQLEQLKTRISQVREVVGQGGSLPFGRAPA